MDRCKRVNTTIFDYFVTGLPEDADRETEIQPELPDRRSIRYKPQQNPWSGSFSVNRMDSDNDNFSDGLWTGSTCGRDSLNIACGLAWSWTSAKNHRVGFALEHQDIDFSQRGEATVVRRPQPRSVLRCQWLCGGVYRQTSHGFTWTASTGAWTITAILTMPRPGNWQHPTSYPPTLRLRGSAGNRLQSAHVYRTLWLFTRITLSATPI